MTRRQHTAPRRWPAPLLAAALLCAAAACDQGPPDTSGLFNRVTLIESSPDGGADRAALEQRVVERIDSAERSVDIAFEDMESDAIADALVRAQARGVDVEVVSDAESSGQWGFLKLSTELQPAPDGDVPIRFGDGDLDYSPMPTVTLTRAGFMNRMTHNFLIVDERHLINLSGGFPRTPDCGVAGDCELPTFRQVGFEATSEDFRKDFGDEFVQMYGGVFSTTLDTFNGQQKSDTNARNHYPTDSGDLELYFGPQERLLKRVIDEIYAARSSVWISSEEFANDFAAEALIYKASAGFDVRVVIEPDGGACESTADCPGQQRCVEPGGGAPSSCEVPFNAVDRLRTGFEERKAEGAQVAEVRELEGIRQTVIVIDAVPSPVDGRTYATHVMVLSQPFTSAISYVQGQIDTPRPSDGFMDSNMWVFNAYPNKEDPEVEALADNVLRAFDAGEPAQP